MHLRAVVMVHTVLVGIGVALARIMVEWLSGIENCAWLSGWIIKAMARNKANVAAQQGGLDTRDYVYSVVWSEEDQAFIGRVLEFPSLAAHGSTQAKALSEIRSVVQHALDDLARSGEEVPEPLNKRAYSGKLNVRLPKYIHRQLAIEAAEEGVSLNQLISTKLAATRGTHQGLKKLRRPQRGT